MTTPTAFSVGRLAEVFDGVGLPRDVCNLVTGLGPVVGEAFAAHPDVDIVPSTGSTAPTAKAVERSWA